MRRLKTGRRPPIYPKTPGHLPCSSLTHPLPLPSRRPSVSFGGFGFNGSDEGATSPDHPFWSARADGTPANEPSFSVGSWVNLENPAALQYILSKFDKTTGATQKEWDFTTGGNRGETFVRDESSNGYLLRKVSGTHPVGAWVFIVATYDGSGLSAGISIYVNAIPSADGIAPSGTYSAMEDTTSLVRLAFRQGRSNTEFYFGGKMAGGPLGPFFVQGALSPAQILDLYNAGASAMGLIP